MVNMQRFATKQETHIYKHETLTCKAIDNLTD
jgi:hypothetical protein